MILQYTCSVFFDLLVERIVHNIAMIHLILGTLLAERMQIAWNLCELHWILRVIVARSRHVLRWMPSAGFGAESSLRHCQLILYQTQLLILLKLILKPLKL